MRVEAANVKISGTFENETVSASEGRNKETSGSIRRNAKVKTESAIPTYFSFPAISSCSAFVSWI